VIFTILRQNNDRQLKCPHVCANSDLCTVTVSLEFATPAHGALRLQPTNRAMKLNWVWIVQWVVDISVFQHSLECLYSLTLV